MLQTHKFDHLHVRVPRLQLENPCFTVTSFNCNGKTKKYKSYKHSNPTIFFSPSYTLHTYACLYMFYILLMCLNLFTSYELVGAEDWIFTKHLLKKALLRCRLQYVSFFVYIIRAKIQQLDTACIRTSVFIVNLTFRIWNRIWFE